MRIGLALAAIAAFFLPSAALAASDVRACQGIELVSPAKGAHFIGSRPIMFRWSGEPVGTVSRELHLAALDGSETVVPLGGRFSDTVKVKLKGDLAWAVLFKDAKGNSLCVALAGLLRSGPTSGQLVAAGGSLSSSVSGGAGPVAVPQVSVFMNNGRLVIVLQNSPYAGQYTKLVASDNYDGRNEDLQGAVGLEIHGNDERNVIFGSSGPDLIYAYDSPDFVNPGPGQDEVHFGLRTKGGTDSALEGVASADGEIDTIYCSCGLQIGGVHGPSGESTNIDGSDIHLPGP